VHQLVNKKTFDNLEAGL